MMRAARRTARNERPPPRKARSRLPLCRFQIARARTLAEHAQAPDDPAIRQRLDNRLCINCHGTHDKPGSLPTSLRFAAGKFKNDNDPYTMYQTLSRGFGMMIPQTWMVPQQKYDVEATRSLTLEGFIFSIADLIGKKFLRLTDLPITGFML